MAEFPAEPPRKRSEMYEPKPMEFPAIERLRKRPAMYLGDLTSVGLPHYILSAINWCLDEGASKITFTAEKENYFVTADASLHIEELESGLITPLEVFPSMMGRSESATLAALSASFELDAVCEGVHWQMQFLHGTKKKISKNRIAGPSYVRMKFCPAPEIFQVKQISPASFHSFFRTQAHLSSGIEFTVHTSSKTQNYHSKQGFEIVKIPPYSIELRRVVPRTVVFLSVPWSAPEQHARQIFKSAAVKLFRRKPYLYTQYRIANADSEETRQWLSNLGHSEMASTGAGGILWLHCGRVVFSTVSANLLGEQGIIDRTQLLWSS